MERASDRPGTGTSGNQPCSPIRWSRGAWDEWLSLFDDPILGNSALDRLANASYRERLSLHRALLDKGGD